MNISPRDIVPILDGMPGILAILLCSKKKKYDENIRTAVEISYLNNVRAKYYLCCNCFYYFCLLVGAIWK